MLWIIAGPWFYFSVLNESETVEFTIEKLHDLHYMDYEIIVINDGSTDV
ncbi:glycosyltransferase [Peribacillus kribbensis]|nr:glycosyltransferase [Peribacillus kribbensis]